MLTTLKRISISLTYQDKDFENKFCVFGEHVADQYLVNLGKCNLLNTQIIQMSYMWDKSIEQRCVIGPNATRIVVVEGYFDFDKFRSFKDENSQRQMLLADIHSRMIFFAETYKIATVSLMDCYNKSKLSDFFLKMDSFTSSNKKHKVILEYCRNFNDISYRIKKQINGINEFKVFDISTNPILGIRDVQGLTISDFINVVPSFKVEGWKDDRYLIMRFGGNDKLVNEEYIFDAEEENLIKSVYKSLGESPR